jgi:hypothetical protein
MTSKKKSNFVVLTAITLHGVQRTKGYEFTACADGVHVTRWLKAGKIRRAE